MVLGCSAHMYEVLGSCGHNTVAQKGLVPTLIIESVYSQVQVRC